MAFFSDLVRTIASAEGMDEMTVTGIGQYVREAGHITKAGRGRAAARMTSSDAAALLIAVNASAKAKEAAEAVGVFSALVLTEDLGNALWAPPGLTGVAGVEDELWDQVMARGCPFDKALTRLVEMAMPGEGREPYLTTHGWGPNRVALTIDFARPQPEVLISAEDAPGLGEEFDGEHVPRVLLHARFTTAAPRPVGMSDRRDRTSIGSRTLLAVGQALAA